MNKRKVDTLIIDLDNTIFDWFALWFAGFKPIYDEILRASGQPQKEVEASIRAVHQARRTSEYTFLIEEVSVLQALRDERDIRALFGPAMAEAKHLRDKETKLYPTVFRTLWDLKRRGVKIVAYTESMGFYSAFRLKRFGLDGVIDTLFSPEDHELPRGVSLEKLRSLPDDYYELQVTEVRHTPPGELKPNPAVLLDIVRSVGAQPERCAYVGDSLFKDVAMARDVGIFDIHAEYGESQRLPEYDLLRNVSHWTQEDVEREREIIEFRKNVKPTVVLKEVFAEIFMYCEFESFSESPAVERTSIGHEIEIWKKVVDVQQHFNDLEMRTRNFAITTVGVLIAAVGFTYQMNLQADVLGHKFPAGLGLVLAAAFAWLSFFLMDLYWYHVLLKGAVIHASKIEDSLEGALPGISLGKTISAESQKVKIFGMFRMNSTKRLIGFYLLGFVMLAVVFATLWLAAPGVLVPDSSLTQAPAEIEGLPPVPTETPENAAEGSGSSPRN